MAVTPNQPNTPKLTPEEQELREQVDLVDKQALGWKNILSLRLKAKAAAKEERNLRDEIVKLGREEARNAIKAKETSQAIRTYEKELQQQKAQGNRRAVTQLMKDIAFEKKALADLNKTRGGALMVMSLEAKRRKDNLTAEKKLIQDINKERGIGGRLADLFRTKEQKQRQIDIARAKAGGGANIPPGGGAGGTGAAAGGSAGGGGGVNGKVVAGVAGAGALLALFMGLKSALGGIAGAIKSSLVAPLAAASGLVSGGIGGGMGVGGGAISGAGATSILGGFQDIASKIPFIGGLLGGLIGAFKGIVDLVLGIDQGITNFARNLGISKNQAKTIKGEFIEIAKNSNSVVVNETRLMESQAELTKALGIRSQFSASILENNIKLKEIAGLELETRKSIAQTSIIQNRNAEELTKSVLAQSKAFEFQTGVAFEYRDILNQASKQAGVLGLTFAKYPEKLTKALMTTKAMGFELKQLDSLADSFLNFEESISKEMEAQVLTGKDMNLTRAREAALNNDLVTLAKEINTQVGSTEEFLNMNRIRQESIAAAVGMTRDSLADALKQQEYYGKLGATNLKQAQEELRILRERGLSEKEINRMIGEDAYNYITQTSTAERLTELMNKIKNIFVSFVENSGILDFITNPERIANFAKGLIERLAGAVELIGTIIGGLLDIIARLPFTDTAKWQGMASQVRTGTTSVGGTLRAAAGNIGGLTAQSVGATVESGARQTTTQQAAAAPSPYRQAPVEYVLNATIKTQDNQTIGHATQRGQILVPTLQ